MCVLNDGDIFAIQMEQKNSTITKMTVSNGQISREMCSIRDIIAAHAAWIPKVEAPTAEPLRRE